MKLLDKPSEIAEKYVCKYFIVIFYVFLIERAEFRDIFYKYRHYVCPG